MKAKTKLPPGWEKCKTGINGVRKWRNMATHSTGMESCGWDASAKMTKIVEVIGASKFTFVLTSENHSYLTKRKCTMSKIVLAPHCTTWTSDVYWGVLEKLQEISKIL